MANTTTCTRCGELYEAGSDEQANEAARVCQGCRVGVLKPRSWQVDDGPIDYARIPSRLMEALQRYVRDGIPPGQFLQAVLRNDLQDAVARGDAQSLAALRHVVGWLYNCAASSCWGRPEAVEEWLATDARRRQLFADAAARDGEPRSVRQERQDVGVSGG
jgi:hypothetical protein